jgi:transposase
MTIHFREYFFRWIDFEYRGEKQSIMAKVNAYYASVQNAFKPMSIRTAYKWANDRRRDNIWYPKKKRGTDRSRICDEHVNFLINHIDNIDSQLYLKEMVNLQDDAFRRRYAISSIKVALNRRKYTNRLVEHHAREANPVLQQQFRNIFRPVNNGGLFSANQIVFVDETAGNEKKGRRRWGWGRAGLRIIIRVRRNIGHGGRCMALCAMNITGIISSSIVDTQVDGTVNAQVYQNYLVNDLLPKMNPYPQPNSVLVMDGASVHNRNNIYQLCHELGIRLFFLPPYSPIFNPIEFAFHSIHLHTKDIYHYEEQEHQNEYQIAFNHALWNSVTANHACNYFRHCFIHVTDNEREYANRRNHLVRG